MSASHPLLRPLHLATVALLALSVSGCIILPVGHRHHGGRHLSERAVVVVPVERGRDGHDRHHRRHRDYRGDRD